MKKVVIFGTGDMAKLSHFFFTNDSDYTVVAFTINAEFIKDPQFQGLPVVGFETITEAYPPDEFEMFVSVGPQNCNEFRENIYYQAKDKGYKLASYISSRADFWNDLKHGENVMIIQDSSIEPFVVLGNNVTLIGSKIGYNVKIEDHCFISTATIGSDVVVKNNAFVGINTSINPALSIGVKSIIGSGSIISKDVDDYAVYVAPATARKSEADSRRFRL